MVVVGNPLPAAAAHEVCVGCTGPEAGVELAGGRGVGAGIATGAMGLATGAGTCAGTTCEGTTCAGTTLLDPSSSENKVKSNDDIITCHLIHDREVLSIMFNLFF